MWDISYPARRRSVNVGSTCGAGAPSSVTGYRTRAGFWAWGDSGRSRRLGRMTIKCCLTCQRIARQEVGRDKGISKGRLHHTLTLLPSSSGMRDTCRPIQTFESKDGVVIHRRVMNHHESLINPAMGAPAIEPQPPQRRNPECIGSVLDVKNISFSSFNPLPQLKKNWVPF